LALSATDSVTIGTVTPVMGNNFLAAWTSDPNGVTDPMFANDSAFALVEAFEPLCGTYTIGTGANFTTFADAIYALEFNGVTCPVVFEVQPGTYNERLEFDGNISGVSATNTITFTGEPGAVIYHSPTVTGERAAIALMGASHFRFDNLKIELDPAATWGWGIYIGNNTIDTEITNCYILTDVASTNTTNYKGIVASGSATSATTASSGISDILIQNNTIIGGYHGVIIYGSAASQIQNTYIIGNEFIDQLYYGVRYFNTVEPIATHNTFNLRGTNTFSRALHTATCEGPFNFSYNIINNVGQYGIYISSTNAPLGNASLIANNAIGAGFTNTGSLASGIYATTTTNIDIYYNSINSDATLGNAIYMTNSATGLNIKNNSFVYSGGSTGYAAYFASTTSVTAIDYNNYYSNGSNFVFYGSAMPNLTTLQALNIPVNNDANSVSGDPLYTTDNLLYPIGSLLNNAGTPIASISDDIIGTLRDATTPDIGAYEFSPIPSDISLKDGTLLRGQCLSNNDTVVLTIRNILGPTVNFSTDPLTLNWTVTGPVNSNGTIVYNTGTLDVNNEIDIIGLGVDMSAPGNYSLSAYIEPNAVNLLQLNDTLKNVFTIDVVGYTFAASHDSVLITNSVDTVVLSVTSNLFPGGNFMITEVCHFKYPPGEPVGGWPSYLIADDYIEITGVPGSDLAGYTLEQWSTTAMHGTHTFSAGTVLSPQGTAIIAVGELGSSVPSPSNYYYHGNGTYTGTFGSTVAAGRILKDPSGNIVDAVGYGTYTFPAAANVTPADWSGNTPAVSSSGNRLVGPYTKDATNWINSGVSPQDPNTPNSGVAVPVPGTLDNFTWSLNGTVISYNNPDTVVGPYTVNGLYQYVATYTTPCGVFTDTVNIHVGIPPHDLVVDSIISPITDICYDGNEFVAIQIRNYGADTLFGGFTASYTIDGGTAVNELVNDTIIPGGSIIYTFTTPIDFVLTDSDSVFYLNTYAYVATDPYQHNDTLGATFTFQYIPVTPIGTPDTITYGAQAELIATANAPILWYTDMLSQVPIHSGDTLITPPLFATTTYYAEASNNTLVNIGLPAVSSSPSSGAGTTNFGMVFDVFAPTLLKSVTIYPVSTSNSPGTVTIEVIDGAGTVLHTTTANVVGSPTASPSPHVIDLDFNLQPGTNLKLRHERTGITGLLFEPSSGAPGGNYGYPFEIPGIIRINSSTLTAHPTNTPRNDLYYYFYDWEVGAPGCSSDRIPVEAYVILPQYEAGVVEILTPVDDCTDNTETVSILISNNGYDDITSNLTATYVVNGGTPVSETVNITVPAGDTVPFAFATPINLTLTSGDTTLNIMAYVSHPGDPYQANDTATTTAVLAYIPPMPVAVHDTVPYGTSATVGVNSSYAVSWYASPTSDVVLDTGNTFVTPILYGNTPYYASATSSSGGGFIITEICHYKLSSTGNPVGGWPSYLIADDYIEITGPPGADLAGYILEIWSTTALSGAHAFGSGTILSPQGTAVIATGQLGSSVPSPANFYYHSGHTTTLSSTIANGYILKNPAGEIVDAVVYGNMTFPAAANVTPADWTGVTPAVSSAGNRLVGPYTKDATNWVNSGVSPQDPNIVNLNVEVPVSGCESDRTQVWAIVTGNPAVDAGVVSIDLPVSPTDLQLQDAHVTIQNFGTDPLTSTTIEWTHNGVPQIPFSWTGNLVLSQTEMVNIGSFTPTLGSNYLVAWTTNPNGVTDPMPLNDTTSAVIEAFEPLCGVLTIGGVNPNFATFAQALYALNNYGVSCPVTFEVRSGTYNESVELSAFNGASAVNTVTFKPDAGATVTLTSSSSDATLKISNAAHYIFDGSNSGTDSRDFSVINTSQGTNTAAVWLAAVNDSITIKNMNIAAGINSITSTFGIYLGGATITTTGTGNNNNITLHNNAIRRSYFGIYARSTAALQNSNLKITNNRIGSNNVSDYVLFRGVDIQGANAPLIEANTIFNLKVSTSVNNAGIDIGQGVLNGKISKNRIHGIYSHSSTGYGAYGINISSGTSTSGIEISNNFISDIQTVNYSTTSTLWNAFGIRITGGSGYKIWYNSINLHGTIPPLNTNASMSAALIVTVSSVTGMDVRNNIFANSTQGLSGSKHYAVYVVSGTTFSEINYNNYFVSGPHGILGYNGTDLSTLQAWRTFTGKDLNSLNVNPAFVSPNNLHTFSTSINDMGTPIAGIVDDIEGTIRSTTTPDIGAFEFDPLDWDMSVVEVVSPVNYCYITGNEIIAVKVKNTGLNTVTSFNVSYTINNGTPVTEPFTGSLATDSTITFTFATTADLSANVPYTISFEVDLTGDQYAMNDTMSVYLRTKYNLATNYAMGFEANEDMSGWKSIDLNNDGRTWEFPFTSATLANTGTQMARFVQVSTAQQANDWLVSECLELEAGRSYKVEFAYRASSTTGNHNVSLRYGTDLADLPGFNTSPVQLTGVNNTTYNNAATIITPTQDTVYYFAWHKTSFAHANTFYLDDINIRILEPVDAGIVDILNIGSHENGMSALTPEVKIKNWGSDTLTIIPVKYIVNGGTPVTETWIGTLLPDSSVNYTFNTAFTVPNGNFSFCALTALSGDGNNGNDTLCITTFGIPLITPPFADDFEGSMNLYTIGATNQWQHGIPSASVINNAHSPVNVWATNLTGNYNDNSNYNLFTPRFNFSSVVNAVVGFWHWYDTESGNDGGRLQYTVNNGATWQTLGIMNDPLGANWYNTDNVNGAPAFTGASSGWVYSEFDLSQFNNFPVPVQFRFNFFANSSINFNGWAIDDFEIYQAQIPLDAGVVAIVNPSGSVVTGSTQNVEVIIKNLGTDPLTTIPVRYRVNNGVPVQEQWTGNLMPGDSVNYIFNQTITQAASYGLCAWTRVTGDTYTNNDTSCTSINIIPAQFDAGVVEIIAPDLNTIINQPVNISARIKNFGTETLTTFDIAFDINAGAQTVETWTGTLAPNEEMIYDFTATYISPSGNYVLCVETKLSNDQNSTNNRVCKNLNGNVGIGDEHTADVFTIDQNVPNPAQLYTVIGYNIPKNGKVIFTLSNILGQVMAEESGTRIAGRHEILLETATLPKGLYYYSIEFEGQRLVKKLIVE